MKKMSEKAASVPLSEFMSMLNAIIERNWLLFKDLELQFVDNYSIDIWEEVFNFRLLPALDTESKRWFLIEKCKQGILEVKVVG
jgi:hypothetical protein